MVLLAAATVQLGPVGAQTAPVTSLGEVTSDAFIGAHRLYRDAGYSTSIPGTGRAFWVFGDTIGRTAAGLGCWPGGEFLKAGGTAATAFHAPDDQVSLIEDPDDGCGTEEFFPVSTALGSVLSACQARPADAPGYLAAWPRSTVAGPEDRSVLVYYQVFCVKQEIGVWRNHPVSTYVARWDLDPLDPDATPVLSPADIHFLSDQCPVSETCSADRNRGYNSGAVVDGPWRYVYRHQATGTSQGMTVSVARVHTADDRWRLPQWYTYWNPATGTWDAAPPPPTSGSIADNVQTTDNISVSWYPPLQRYVMTYNRPVGAAEPAVVAFRVADDPVGPWSVEHVVPLRAASEPGCTDTGLPCRHAFAHPEHSGVGGLVVSVVESRFGGVHHLLKIDDEELDFLCAPLGTQVDGTSDVLATNPFCADILWAAQPVDGGRPALVTGYPDGTFRPTDEVSRQVFAAFLHRLAGEPPSMVPCAEGPPAVTPFDDVAWNSPFCDAVAWASEVGVISGFPSGAFGATWPVTRQSAAAFLHRMAGEPAPSAPCISGSSAWSPFSDVDPGSGFCDAIAWASEEGVVGGYGDGTFRPTTTVSRQTATALLHRYEDNVGVIP